MYKSKSICSLKCLGEFSLRAEEETVNRKSYSSHSHRQITVIDAADSEETAPGFRCILLLSVIE